MNLKLLGLPAVVFLLAAALRVAWVLLSWSKTGAALEFPDEDIHWQLARNLIDSGSLVTDDGRFAARMPVYPLLLALFAWIGDNGVLLARIAQALVGGATAWVAYLLADRALGRRAAIVAGVLVCFDPFAIFFANLLLTETLFSFLAIALVACAWCATGGLSASASIVPLPSATGGLSASVHTGGQAASGTRAATGVAVLVAAAVMTRPSAAGWILLLWIVLWLLDSNRWRATRRLALCVAVMAACLLPWGLRNRAVIGAPAWLSTNGGVTLYDAQGPQAAGDSNQAFLGEMPQLANMSECESDRELRQLAIEQMRKDPKRILELAWVKFRRTWSLTPNVTDYSGGATALVSAAYTIVVLLLALAGLVRSVVARRWHLQTLIWLPVAYFTLIHCIFVGSLRYRVPLMPLLAVAAATLAMTDDEKVPNRQ